MRTVWCTLLLLATLSLPLFAAEPPPPDSDASPEVGQLSDEEIELLKMLELLQLMDMLDDMDTIARLEDES